jgi:hypothetical protein
MWGQGLADEHKFSHLTARWICEQRNGGICSSASDVDVQVEAHSGAVLAEADPADQKKELDCLQEVAPPRCRGEVPYAYPTIWSQVDLAVRHYSQRSIPAETIDLILVDGGINDMGALKILNPLSGNIVQHAKNYCNDPMKRLLVKTHGVFPNAVIVVAGYFPLVSRETPLDVIFKAIHDLFPEVHLLSADKKAIKESVEAEGEPAKARANILESPAERSRKWKDASDAALQDAVSDFNKAQPGNPANQWSIFTTVKFSDENAYAASNSFLWQLGPKGQASFECPNYQGLLGTLLKNLIVNDEQQLVRPCACILAGMDHGGDGIFCMRAGAFHPNRLGAQAYFEAIRNRLDNLRRNGTLKL